MKKFTLFAVLVMIATSMFAIDKNTSLTPIATSSLAKASVPMKLGKKMETSNESISLPDNSVKKVAADVADVFVGKTVTDDPVNASGVVSVDIDGTDITMTGLFFGFPNAVVTGTYNDGTITIPSGQVIYTSSTYGACGLYAMKDKQYFTRDNIVLELQEDGSIKMKNGIGLIMLILEGEYANYSLGDTYVGGFELYPVNGAVEYELVKSDLTPENPATKSFPTYTKLTFDESGELTGGFVCGLDGFTWLPFTVTGISSGFPTVSFSQDKVYYYGKEYGLAYPCFAGEVDGSWGLAKTAGPKGLISVEEGLMIMNPWCYILPLVDESTFYIFEGRKNVTRLTFTPVSPTGINGVKDITTDTKTRKVVENGKVVIEKNGMRFNAVGARMK